MGEIRKHFNYSSHSILMFQTFSVYTFPKSIKNIQYRKTHTYLQQNNSTVYK